MGVSDSLDAQCITGAMQGAGRTRLQVFGQAVFAKKKPRFVSLKGLLRTTPRT
jgi:hypothetical protein